MSGKAWELPVLGTQRLVLRAFRPDDVLDFYEIGCDTHVTRHITLDTFKSLEDAGDFVTKVTTNYQDEKGYYFWAIEERSSNKLIGTASFVQWSFRHRWAELGFMVNKNYWNRGITTEAMNSVIRYCFDDLGFNKVIGRAFQRNEASNHVLQKLGMTFEGIQRQHMIKDGEFVDLNCYSLLYETYQKEQSEK
ncbi:MULTISPECIES: GNAT family N-acetyltransferase [unclassified Fusibacter]|uniref:GNAT family N-acetyltransferase n=1 Tax=unclassified Fusibacter TaxID=2624464 RepID=UPI0010112F57|nr:MULTISPECIES: GNAT family N-acetyltransferase [unclassified Fusibacter]MCK8061571.1 GNAT family N-acetyltransferase [Fusibacter sp. A2]NPE23701.1 GNAT family N-acetyltransferase [Fusibacter sp. A1]RXV58728.1 N-acetyltransferase [Fusibacter sp. A1]